MLTAMTMGVVTTLLNLLLDKRPMMRRRLRKNPITERPMAVKARRLLVSVENTIFMSSDSDTLQDAMVVVPGTW